jgi:hypothetical protein
MMRAVVRGGTGTAAALPHIAVAGKTGTAELSSTQSCGPATAATPTLLLTTEAIVAEELIAQPGAVIAPGFGDLARGSRGPRRRSDPQFP